MVHISVVYVQSMATRAILWGQNCLVLRLANGLCLCGLCVCGLLSAMTVIIED